MVGMDARINFITVAVTDLSACRRFYLVGLGWKPTLDSPGIVMVRVSSTLVLSLWAIDEFEAEVGAVRTGPGVAPFTLAHNVPTPEAVDQVLEEARHAGASSVVAGRWRDWGGYSGYFADPEGVCWEVAYNPDPLGRELMAASGLLAPAEPDQ